MNTPTLEQIEDEIREGWNKAGVPAWAIEASRAILLALAYERLDLFRASERIMDRMARARQSGDRAAEHRVRAEYERAMRRYHEACSYLLSPIVRLTQRTPPKPVRVEVP